MEHFEFEKQQKITSLTKSIIRFTWFAFGLTIIGIIPLFFIGKLNSFSEWGEYLGGTTGSVWALAGLIFIYVAFLGQKQQLLYQEIEIALNREELKLTREELKGQKEELEEQNKLNRLKRFEDTYFNFLSIINELANGFEETSEMTYSTTGVGQRKDNGS